MTCYCFDTKYSNPEACASLCAIRSLQARFVSFAPAMVVMTQVQQAITKLTLQVLVHLVLRLSMMGRPWEVLALRVHSPAQLKAQTTFRLAPNSSNRNSSQRNHSKLSRGFGKGSEVWKSFVEPFPGVARASMTPSARSMPPPPSEAAALTKKVLRRHRAIAFFKGTGVPGTAAWVGPSPVGYSTVQR